MKMQINNNSRLLNVYIYNRYIWKFHFTQKYIFFKQRYSRFEYLNEYKGTTIVEEKWKWEKNKKQKYGERRYKKVVHN